MRCRVMICPETSANPKGDGWLHVRGIPHHPPEGAWYCRDHGEQLEELFGDTVSIEDLDANGNVITGTKRFVTSAGRA